MSSVTGDEPESEDSRLDESRPGRGRGRRGRLFRRQDDDRPAVGEMDADDAAELMRLSGTSMAPAAADDTPADDPPAEEKPEGRADPSVHPGVDDEPSSAAGPASAGAAGGRAQEAEEIDWLAVIDRSVAPLTDGYDKPDRAAAQLAWLRDAGFEAEIVWEQDDLALLVADRP